jgi:uncharacterized lipoprotein
MMTQRIFAYVCLCSLLSACSNSRICDDPQPYEAAQAGRKIEAPDGLDDLRASREIDIPEASRRDERQEGEPCLDYPPILRTDSSED